MDIRERIVTALRGELPDHVPWTIYRGLLIDCPVEVQQRLRAQGLGLVVHQRVYTAERPHVRLSDQPAEVAGETVRVRTYETPVGRLVERRRTEPGYGSSWIYEHFVKEPRDYEVLEFIIRDTVYRPDYASYLQAQGEIGPGGIVNTAVLRMPFQRLWIEFTGLERLLYDLHDHPALVEGVLQAMLEKDREMWALVAASPAEFVWAPDNLTARAISPRLFDRYFAPYYEALAAVMHAAGKWLYCHVDGATQGLVDRIARTPIDIVEAFTPEPTGDLSLAEARRAWPGKAIWINFPSSVLVEAPDAVARVTRDLLRQAAPGGGFLMGVTENVPSWALGPSLGAITETVARYGRCPLPA